MFAGKGERRPGLFKARSLLSCSQEVVCVQSGREWKTAGIETRGRCHEKSFMRVRCWHPYMIAGNAQKALVISIVVTPLALAVFILMLALVLHFGKRGSCMVMSAPRDLLRS